jgi:hypothetical protein
LFEAAAEGAATHNGAEAARVETHAEAEGEKPETSGKIVPAVEAAEAAESAELAEIAVPETERADPAAVSEPAAPFEIAVLSFLRTKQSLLSLLKLYRAKR